MFQSAPAIAGGRCAPRLGTAPGPTGFNPRPPLLAGDATTRCSWVKSVCGFNPRPPLLAGDARRRCHLGRPCRVSIRARHCWRAMPPATPGEVLFIMFQSAPAIAGGRCVAGPATAPRCRCFNPRPPLLAGDAPAVQVPALPRRVSIRARHCWRAMLGRIAGRESRQEFQSAPAIAGGRCFRACSHSCGSARFNPRPPLLAGDAA